MPFDTSIYSRNLVIILDVLMQITLKMVSMNYAYPFNVSNIESSIFTSTKIK